VANKIDVASVAGARRFEKNGVDGVCPISALTGTGVDRLLARMSAILDGQKERARFCFSPGQGALLSVLRHQGRILEERYEQDAIHVTALVSPKLAGQIRRWMGANGSGGQA
jgi:GTP-binding protein HflX